MDETEAIMRRKAKRINIASKMIRNLEFDIKQVNMIDVDKLGLLKSVELLKVILKNDDKFESKWNK